MHCLSFGIRESVAASRYLLRCHSKYLGLAIRWSHLVHFRLSLSCGFGRPRRLGSFSESRKHRYLFPLYRQVNRCPESVLVRCSTRKRNTEAGRGIDTVSYTVAIASLEAQVQHTCGRSFGCSTAQLEGDGVLSSRTLRMLTCLPSVANMTESITATIFPLHFLYASSTSFASSLDPCRLKHEV